jgi:hypothetical protein
MRTPALEHWLTKAGDRVVRKAASAGSEAALDDGERLLYEYWLFDTEQRNGGISQYFCNRGLDQWDTLSRFAVPTLPTFPAFAAVVNGVVGRSSDPYEAVIDSSVDLDAEYERWHDQLVTELHTAARPIGPPEAVAAYDATWSEAHAPRTGGPPCPKCGRPLRTAKAQQCFLCGAKWHGRAAAG